MALDGGAPAPSDESRCTRTGTGWRCHRSRLPGHVYCRIHHLHYLARRDRSRSSKPKIPSTLFPPSAVPSSAAAPTVADPMPAPGQVWALLHELDALPHSYARVERLIPGEAQAEVRLLDPYPSTEAEMRRSEQGLPIACGIFRSRDSTQIEPILSFSHPMVYMQGKGKGKALGSQPYFRIFPQKGEVWAIYLESGEPEGQFTYKLVEVVSGFKDEEGVSVAGLMAVEGEEGVFERQFYAGFGLFRTFSRRELVRFSHRVPACRMEESGGQGGQWKVLLP